MCVCVGGLPPSIKVLRDSPADCTACQICRRPEPHNRAMYAYVVARFPGVPFERQQPHSPHTPDRCRAACANALRAGTRNLAGPARRLCHRHMPTPYPCTWAAQSAPQPRCSSPPAPTPPQCWEHVTCHPLPSTPTNATRTACLPVLFLPRPYLPTYLRSPRPRRAASRSLPAPLAASTRRTSGPPLGASRWVRGELPCPKMLTRRVKGPETLTHSRCSSVQLFRNLILSPGAANAPLHHPASVVTPAAV